MIHGVAGYQLTIAGRNFIINPERGGHGQLTTAYFRSVTEIVIHTSVPVSK